MQQDPSRRDGLLGLIARGALIVVGIVVLALFFWQVVNALLLAFAGLLLAIFWRGLARRLSKRTHVPIPWALLIVALCVAALVGGIGWLLGPNLVSQMEELIQKLPETLDRLEQGLRQQPWSRYVLENMLQAGETQQLELFSRVTGAASTVLSILTGIIIVIFVAIFFAIDPDLYKRGIVLLVPKRQSDRARETLDVSSRALWRWLLGRIASMIAVGLLTALGLWLLGVPLPLALGLIAALLDFVPFFGPIAAAVPGILLATTVSPMTAVWTALLYFVIQQIEGNLITPIIQKEVVSLPPVLTVLVVVGFTYVFGILGAFLATPLTVLAMVLIKMLYVEDVLGKHTTMPGDTR